LKILNKTLSPLLYRLVNEQLIVAFTILNIKENKSHGIPIWIATDGIHLFFYSQSNTRKIKLLEENPFCTIIFNYGSVEGDCVLISKPDTRFFNYFKVFDPRYNHLPDYKKYKNLWDIIIIIDPVKIRTFY
jgi:hypothetical protein